MECSFLFAKAIAKEGNEMEFLPFCPIFQSCEHDDIYMPRTQIILLLLDATSNLSLYL